MPKRMRQGDVKDMTGESVEEIFKDMQEQNSDFMRFELKREPEPGRSFSADGLEDLMLSLKLFIGARVAAHWEQSGHEPEKPGPSRLGLELKVIVDDESWSVEPDMTPWYATVDGGRRAGSVH